jgi:hypothetical protein
MDEETCGLIRRIKSMRDRGTTYRAIADELGVSKSLAARLYKKWTPAMGELRADEILDDDEFAYTGDTDSLLPMDDSQPATDRETDEWEDAGFEKAVWLDDLTVNTPAEGANRQSTLSTPQSLHGPAACPFLYDGSPEAEAWFQHLVRTHPGRTDDSILRDYAAGEPWCRPPGAAPPYDPDDPFSAMEVTIDDHGNEIFVEERFETGKPCVWYLYRSDGCLIRYVNNDNGVSGEPANVNLFGKWAVQKKGKTRSPWDSGNS